MRILLLLLALSASGLAFYFEKVEGPASLQDPHEAFLETVQKAVKLLNHSELVFGGQRAALGDFPTQAYLSYRSRQGGSYICGASLLTATHVVTAAHCAYDLISGQLLFGSVDLDQKGPNAQARQVSGKVVHSGYAPNSQQIQNDIAVLEFQPAVTINRYVQLSKIPSNDVPVLESGKAIVSGFGTYTFQNGESVTSRYLLYAEVDLVLKSVCRQRWSGAPIADSQLCAGSRGRGVGPGDSGGPMQVRHGGQFYEVGLASFVYDDQQTMQYGQDRVPNVFTRVSSFCSFMQQAASGFRCVDVGGSGPGTGTGECPTL
uniref:Peptidase S1 domain-containing protein n=1 Tax=Steinernema glaseri TaxID=37863 RepID=A0A1I7XWN9_9BILA